MKLRIHFHGIDTVDLGSGLVGLPGFSFTWEPDGQPDDFGGRVQAEVELTDARYRITGLRIEGHAVTAALLREIPVQGLLRGAVVMAVDRTTPIPTPSGVYGRAYHEFSIDPEVAKAGPTPEALQAVALVYRVAYAVGDHPTKAVAEALELAGSTAARWVMKARAAGYLGETEPGRAGP